jgi:hypothetical protein
VEIVGDCADHALAITGQPKGVSGHGEYTPGSTQGFYENHPKAVETRFLGCALPFRIKRSIGMAPKIDHSLRLPERNKQVSEPAPPGANVNDQRRCCVARPSQFMSKRHRSEALRDRLEAPGGRSEASASRFAAFNPRFGAFSRLRKAPNRRCKASSRRREDQVFGIRRLKAPVRSIDRPFRNIEPPAESFLSPLGSVQALIENLEFQNSKL